MMELAEMIVDLTNSRSPIVHRPLPNDDPRQRRPDITLAMNTLQWTPKVDLRTGLSDTIDYFADLLKNPKVLAALV
jgi:UDP-glucuronate decarboxylase